LNGIQRATHDIVYGQHRGGDIGKVGLIQGNNRARGMETIQDGIACSNFQNIHAQWLLVCFDDLS
jgi:hypothetical protein